MQTLDEEIRNCPTYWFAVMEGAKRQGQFLLAQQALDELRRLGVVVQFRRPGNRPLRPRKGGPDAA